MKKTIIILLSIIGMTVSFSAKAQDHSKITVGVMGGINVFAEPTFTKDGSAIAVFPGSSMFFDITVAEFGKGHLTVGGQTGFQTWKNQHFDVTVAPRVTCGWNVAKGVELHVGATAGLGSSSWRGGGKDYLGFSFSAFGGAEFFFTNHFGLMLEGGYSDYTPDVNAGLVFRF